MMKEGILLIPLLFKFFLELMTEATKEIKEVKI
jgi:hypothetical protein